jgi:hypothetical protein
MFDTQGQGVAIKNNGRNVNVRGSSPEQAGWCFFHQGKVAKAVKKYAGRNSQAERA